MEHNHTASIAFQEFTKARKQGGVGGQVVGLEAYQLRYTGEAESEVANAILAIEAQNAKLVEALKEIVRRFDDAQCDFDGCAEIAENALKETNQND